DRHARGQVLVESFRRRDHRLVDAGIDPDQLLAANERELIGERAEQIGLHELERACRLTVRRAFRHVATFSRPIAPVKKMAEKGVALPCGERPLRGLLEAMRRTLGQIRVFLATNPYTAGATARLSRRAQVAIFLYRLALRILAQWARDKCPQQAA